MPPELLNKLTRLQQHLKTLQTVLIAYSGGTDSAFLLWVALKVLGPESVRAVLIRSELTPALESEAAINLAGKWGADLTVLDREELNNPLIQENSRERCYYCKKERYQSLPELSFLTLLDGSNVDDLNDYRPGRRALQELGVICPLQEAGLNKTEIRALSKTFNLPTAAKPASGCLATRIPYGEPLTREKIQQIAAAEQCLEQMGFFGGRVRHYGKTARIEVRSEDLTQVLKAPYRASIIEKLKTLGFTYITLDLEGYRTGSLNIE